MNEFWSEIWVSQYPCPPATPLDTVDFLFQEDDGALGFTAEEGVFEFFEVFLALKGFHTFETACCEFWATGFHDGENFENIGAG